MSQSSADKQRSFNAGKVRAQFPLIRQSDAVYLDSGATTQKPEAVIRAIGDYYRQDNANVHRAAHRLSARATEAYEQARDTVAGFINAGSRKEIVWTSGTTASINLVASSYGDQHVKAGDEILLSVMEHHSNIVPWQLLAARSGASIRVIPLNDRGELDMAAFERLLSPRTRILALTHVSNALGTVNPIRECIRLAHDAGAVVLIDGAQAVAHFPLDVGELDCDFYVFSGHKLFGPTGIGVLWGRESILEQLPPWQGGGEMIKRVSFEGSSWNSLPWRFEAGTPNIAGAVGLAAAIRFLTDLDRDALLRHEARLLQWTRDALTSIPGLSITGSPEQHAALLSFTLNGFHTYDIGTLLDNQKIAIRTGHHCTMPLMDSLGLPEGTARASFALYNNQADAERLVAGLRQLLEPAIHRVGEDLTAPQTTDSTASSTSDLSEQLLAIRDWQSRYSFIMKLGKQHKGITQQLRSAENQLHGCTSKVWLQHQIDPLSGVIEFSVDSDARVIRGLAAVLLDALKGMTPQQVVAFDMEAHFRELGLIQHLSPSRSNGLRAITEEIQRLAAACC